MEEESDSSEGEKMAKGKDTKECERDVYSFPGDSDPESPPPAPWAHCTYIQRCRKKRVLLRPFSGLGNLRQTLPECKATMSPPKSKPAEPLQHSQDGGVYDFDTFGEGAVEQMMMFPEQEGKTEMEEDGKSEQGPEKDIFTCVECSIYFKKQSHLQEHIVEHCQSSTESGKRSGKSTCFRCVECGWGLPNQRALEDHHRRHQESRLKILEEIEKLNENGRASEIKNSKVVKHISLEPPVMQDASAASISGKETDPNLDASSPLSPAPGSTEGPDSAVTDSDKNPQLVQCPTNVRGVSACRRRFVCTKCNFTTRTSQALANHTKTHNRKKTALKADSQPPGSSSRLASTSSTCFHCAFRTSSQTLMREHQKLLHPGRLSISGRQADETVQHSKSNVSARISKPTLDSELPSGSGSATLSKTTPAKNQHRAPSSEDSTIPDDTAAPPISQVFKSTVNRKFSIRRRTWTDLAKYCPRLDDESLSGTVERDEVPSPELVTECSQKEANSPAGLKPHTGTQPISGKTHSTKHCSEIYFLNCFNL